MKLFSRHVVYFFFFFWYNFTIVPPIFGRVMDVYMQITAQSRSYYKNLPGEEHNSNEREKRERAAKNPTSESSPWV